ncbi:MAG: hypothetical protein FJ224_07375 [Lentisphaerae bacterium]|nr:hypothetical protein [Lentisphaerota bacterium]
MGSERRRSADVVFRLVAGWMLTPLLIVVPMRRLRRAAFAMLFHFLIVPAAMARRVFSRRRRWSRPGVRPGWRSTRLSTRDKGIYEVQW